MHTVKLHGQREVPLLSSAVFDLSEYVRIAADQGLDLDDGDFLAPQFGESPLAEGQPLLAVTAGVKEKVYPLALNDATAAEAVALERALVWHTTQNGPLRLEEQQEGSEAVWWDVQFARFEPETNVRRAARGWRMGVLRVWVAPYATTGTSRLVATAVASGGIVVQTGPIGSLAGDAPALLDVTIRAGAATLADLHRHEGRIAGFAVLPHASYQVTHGPTAFLVHTGKVTAGVWSGLAAASLIGDMQPLFALRLAPPAVYRGRHRLLLRGIVAAQPGAALRAHVDGQPIGPTAVASSWNGQTLIDLGVVTVPSHSAATAIDVRVDGGLLSATGWHGLFHRVPSPVSPNLTVAGAILVPEELSALVVDTARRPVAQDGFDPLASGPLSGTVDQVGNSWLSGTSVWPAAISAGLWLFPASNGFAGNYHPSLTGFRTLGNQVETDALTDMRCEVSTWFEMASSAVLSIEKRIGTDSYIRASISSRASNANGRTLKLAVFSQGSSVTFEEATVAQPIAMEEMLVLETQGPVARASLKGATTVELSASSVAITQPGKPFVWMTATINASAPNPRLTGIRVTAVPSTGAAPSGLHRFDAVRGIVEQQAPDGGWQADVTGRLRGVFPRANVPTCAGVAAFSVPLDGGATIDSTSVEVRIRERFTFIR